MILLSRQLVKARLAKCVRVCPCVCVHPCVCVEERAKKEKGEPSIGKYVSHLSFSRAMGGRETSSNNKY